MKQHRFHVPATLLSLVLVLGFQSILVAGTFSASTYRELANLRRKLKAAHFLSHATFGPTLEDIEALAARMRRVGRRRAFREWIDKQLKADANYHKPLALTMIAKDGFEPTATNISVSRYRHHAWWHNAIAGQDQLRQKMAWALIQLLVIGETGAGFNTPQADTSGQGQWLGMSDYYDTLMKQAFGNYRDVLQDVTYHPNMGVWLTFVKNRKGDPNTGRLPDENYAREIKQLFTIGLHEMRMNGVLRRRKGKLIDTYDNEDIKAFARVFTGLSFAGGTSFFGARRNYNQPMVMYEQYHDTDEKTLLRGKVLPAGQSGDQDISDALDNLFNHPNVAPFIARHLIQRFVMSNPSRGYIRRVARVFNNNGRGVRGDLAAVIRAVLLDRHALRSQVYRMNWRNKTLTVIQRGTETSRLREPVVRYASMFRAFNTEAVYPNNPGHYVMYSQSSTMNQAPYRSPSVFNFYLPDHQPAGDILNYKPSRRIPNGALFAPEFQILTSVTANRFANRLRSDIRDAAANFRVFNRNGITLTCDVKFDFSREEALAEDPEALLQHLDLLLCHGKMRDESRKLIAAAIADATTDPAMRVRGAVLAVLTSPDCAISN